MWILCTPLHNSPQNFLTKRCPFWTWLYIKESYLSTMPYTKPNQQTDICTWIITDHPQSLKHSILYSQIMRPRRIHSESSYLLQAQYFWGGSIPSICVHTREFSTKKKTQGGIHYSLGTLEMWMKINHCCSSLHIIGEIPTVMTYSADFSYI